jgi:hypothetical protein
MKKDKLLQHQLARLNRLLVAKGINGMNMLSGEKVWWDRFSRIFQDAINRSLMRFRASL